MPCFWQLFLHGFMLPILQAFSVFLLAVRQEKTIIATMEGLVDGWVGGVAEVGVRGVGVGVGLGSTLVELVIFSSFLL